MHFSDHDFELHNFVGPHADGYSGLGFLGEPYKVASGKEPNRKMCPQNRELAGPDLRLLGFVLAF